MNTASSSLAARLYARAGAAKAVLPRSAAFRGAYTTEKASAPPLGAAKPPRNRIFVNKRRVAYIAYLIQALQSLT